MESVVAISVMRVLGCQKVFKTRLYPLDLDVHRWFPQFPRLQEVSSVAYFSGCLIYLSKIKFSLRNKSFGSILHNVECVLL